MVGQDVHIQDQAGVHKRKWQNDGSLWAQFLHGEDGWIRANFQEKAILPEAHENFPCEECIGDLGKGSNEAIEFRNYEWVKEGCGTFYQVTEISPRMMLGWAISDLGLGALGKFFVTPVLRGHNRLMH